MLLPLQGVIVNHHYSPGRCPGLGAYCPFRAFLNATIIVMALGWEFVAFGAFLNATIIVMALGWEFIASGAFYS